MPRSKKITCEEIALHFNLNKSTVSRALSGKGSMRDELRQEIMEYARENGYVVAKPKKAVEATQNIAVVLPRNLSGNSVFFAVSLMGITECVSLQNYDVIVVMEEGNTLNRLSGIVEKNKCDGVILLQVYEEDLQTRYLSRQNVPYVAVGTLNEDCYQIDSDTRFASRELVSGLLDQGCKRIAYIGGLRNFTVNKRRYRGYEQAYEEKMLKIDPRIVFHDVESPMQIRYATQQILENKSDCILCGDDVLALSVCRSLVEEGVHVPSEIKVASLYDSVYTELNHPPITAVSIDAREQGFHAAQILMDIIAGKKVDKISKVAANIKWRESTGKMSGPDHERTLI